MKNKFETITLPNNVTVVVDKEAEIKEGDKIFYLRLNQIGNAGEDNLDKNYFSKIIFSSIPLEGVKELPPIPVEEGWGKSWGKVNFEIKEGVNPHAYRLGYLDALKAKQEMFTEEQINKAIEMAQMGDGGFSFGDFKYKKLEIINSFKPNWQYLPKTDSNGNEVWEWVDVNKEG